MRDALFLLAFFPFPFVSLLNPAAGVLIWSWLSFANPHREVYSIAHGQPYNLVIALATLLGIFLSRSGFKLRTDATFWLTVGLALSLVISTAFSLNVPASLEKSSEYLKTLVLLVIISGLMNSKVRIIALIWVIAIALGYFGAKGGLLFIASAGRHQFTGPSKSMIADRNTLALALIMVIPLMNYLRITTQDYLVRLAVLGVIGLTVFAVLGTYSRGGFLALIGMGAFLWWRSRQKIIPLIAAILVIVPAVTLVPESWTQRMETISDASESDNSFRGRMLAWAYSTNAALDRPLVGAGVWAIQEGACLRYMPPVELLGFQEDGCRAAHSIYFELLGALGFSGFLIYMALAFVTWRNTQRIISLAKSQPDLIWLGDLARMIQVSFVGFFIGGAALSMAFYDVYLGLVGLVSAMRYLAEQSKAVSPSSPTSAKHRPRLHKAIVGQRA
jgi:putative inorganic carbon (hco3(-)) transporter